MGLRDPFTKCPLLLHEPKSLVQSRNLCFPLRIVIAKDSKKTRDGFRGLYESFNSGKVAEALHCHPFKMSFPGDMKLQWGALDKGGAAKVKEMFAIFVRVDHHLFMSHRTRRNALYAKTSQETTRKIATIMSFLQMRR
jgi:hypothetical protein